MNTLLPFFLPVAVMLLAICHFVTGKANQACAIVALILAIFVVAALLFTH